MDIVVDFSKSAQENAEYFFEKSKRAKLKAEGARRSAEELKKRLNATAKQEEEKKAIRVVEKREWYEKFNWFFTSSGLLAVGGRSADQNEELYAKHLETPGPLLPRRDLRGLGGDT